jgi:hypothetical protein
MRLTAATAACVLAALTLAALAFAAAPASATFSGPGNVTPTVSPPPKKVETRAQELSKALKLCHKDKKKAKRQKCEKTAHKRYGPVKKKK